MSAPSTDDWSWIGCLPLVFLLEQNNRMILNDLENRIKGPVENDVLQYLPTFSGWSTYIIFSGIYSSKCRIMPKENAGELKHKQTNTNTNTHTKKQKQTKTKNKTNKKHCSTLMCKPENHNGNTHNFSFLKFMDRLYKCMAMFKLKYF